MERSGFKERGENLVKKIEFETRGGQKYYHVTSVLGLINPPSFAVPEDQLVQYAARGSIAHSDVGLILGHSVDLNDRRAWAKILKEGSLGFKPIEQEVFKNFMLQNPEYLWETPVQVEYEMWDEELSLVGTLDLLVIKNKSLTMCDWKTASSYGTDKKEQYFKQMGAYSLMWEHKGMEPVKEFAIFPLNPKNKCGYGSPITTTEVKKYQEMFMEDYSAFLSLIKKP